MAQKTLIVIVGPTAIGKTTMAVEIAKVLNTEIISADSRQIYKEMSVGTAIPSEEDMKAVKHHFIHTISVNDYYNASMFENDVLALLKEKFKEKDVMIMAGGSGLYVDAVCKGIDEIPKVDMEVRNKYINKYEKEGIEAIQEELKEVDPDYYNRIDLNNPKRILKALEINAVSGKPYSSFLTGKRKKRDFNIIKIGSNTDRDVLHKRINKRVDVMVSNGLEGEARKLYRVYKNNKINAINTVGYKEWFGYFNKKYSREEAVNLIKRNTRRYARKQCTWFSKDKEVKWYTPGEKNKIIQYLKKHI